jgi:hypothetical protein
MPRIPDRLWRLAALAVLGLSGIGCTVASASPTSGSPSHGSSPTPTPVLTPAVTQTPTATATPDLPTPTPSASPTFAPLPSIGPAPMGNWTSINWRKVSVAPIVDAPVGLDSRSFQVFGWSRGYLAFETGTATAPFIATSYSTDGLRWKSGVPLDTTKLPEGPIRVGSVVEGPAGLLALGGYGAACGPINVPAMWISSDGISWRFVSMDTAFGGGSVIEIEAGSAGYIATGFTGITVATPAVWTSTDGLSWRLVNVAAKAFGGLVVNNATAFAGGYVLAGAVLAGAAEGCGGPPLMTPSLWWSPDGLTWSRDKVTGTTDAAQATMRVVRISDHALYAFEYGADTSASWASTDGRTWKPAAGVSGWPITNGRRGLSIVEPQESGQQIQVSAFEPDLSVAKLAQTGDVPDQNVFGASMGWPSVTFGPTGLIVANSAGDIWIGIPVAG